MRMDLLRAHMVRSGDFVSIRPRHVMTHDNTGAVIPKFKQIGATINCRSGTASLRDRSRHPKYFARKSGEVREDRSLRARARHRFLPSRNRHFASSDGRTGLRRSRLDGGRQRFAFESLRRDRRTWDAGRAHRCREHLGNRSYVVAGSTGREGRCSRENFRRASSART